MGGAYTAQGDDDSALTLGFAKTLGGWGLGGSYKFIKSKLQASASANTFDAGLISPRYLKGRLVFGRHRRGVQKSEGGLCGRPDGRLGLRRLL